MVESWPITSCIVLGGFSKPRVALMISQLPKYSWRTVEYNSFSLVAVSLGTLAARLLVTKSGVSMATGEENRKVELLKGSKNWIYQSRQLASELSCSSKLITRFQQLGVCCRPLPVWHPKPCPSLLFWTGGWHFLGSSWSLFSQTPPTSPLLKPVRRAQISPSW